ncbi:MAG: DUF167 domain-containing protein [Chloroflexia bacterium]
MPEPQSPVRPAAAGTGVSIRVYVAPRASANKVLGLHNGALKIALTAPPVEGAANKALVEFLAKVLGVPRSAVALLAGESSRHKVVSVAGVALDDALRRLGI